MCLISQGIRRDDTESQEGKRLEVVSWRTPEVNEWMEWSEKERISNLSPELEEKVGCQETECAQQDQRRRVWGMLVRCLKKKWCNWKKDNGV